MKDSFSRLHPLTNLLFFIAATGFSMFLMHPVCLVISLVCALCYALFLGGKQTALFALRFLLPVALVMVLVNPLVSHRGATVLGYLPWGNPFTLESVLYGCASAALVCAVALWFSCFHRVMTSDKIVFLFGRIAPSLSLVLAMALRFVPRFLEQLREIRSARRQVTATGRRTLLSRFKGGLRVFSVLVSRALENSVDTADAMKSRGYGLKGRTAFALFRFHRQDALMCLYCAALSAVVILLPSFRAVTYRYYPLLHGNFSAAVSVLFYVLYAALLTAPLLYNAWEGIRWTRSRSKI